MINLSNSKVITPLFQLKFNTLFQHNKIIQHIIILSSQHITTFTTNIGIFQIKIKLHKLAFQFQKNSANNRLNVSSGIP